MNYLNKIKKIESVALAVAIMVVTSFGESGDVKQCFAAIVKTIECDGVKYQITYKVSGKNYDITTKNLRTKETANLVLNTTTKKGTITQTTYTSTGKAVINKTSYDGNAITPSKTSGISYDGKVEIDMSKHLYYQNGTNGEKTYLKIGRKSDTYRIRTDNLNSAKKKNCKKYQNYVIDGQYNVNKGYANKAKKVGSYVNDSCTSDTFTRLDWFCKCSILIWRLYNFANSLLCYIISYKFSYFGLHNKF